MEPVCRKWLYAWQPPVCHGGGGHDAPNQDASCDRTLFRHAGWMEAPVYPDASGTTGAGGGLGMVSNGRRRIPDAT